MSSTVWKVVGSSVIGFSHVAEGTGCQDAHTYSVLEGGWLIAAVSDGAGSAARSAEGSKIVCETAISHISGEIARLSNGEMAVINEETARTWATNVIELARNRLIASSLDGSILCFNATVVGAVSGPQGGFFFHLGDGAAFATDATQYSPCVLSHPENGENANDTYFFTEPNWSDHLRITMFPSEYNLIALMSDGVTPFALGPKALGPHVPFFAPVSKYLQHHTVEEGEKALTATLSKDEIRRITGDDKTLLWACRS